jgi:hypothetical protein
VSARPPFHLSASALWKLGSVVALALLLYFAASLSAVAFVVASRHRPAATGTPPAPAHETPAVAADDKKGDALRKPAAPQSPKEEKPEPPSRPTADDGAGSRIIKLGNLTAGDSGRLEPQGDRFFFEVRRVLGPSEALVLPVFLERMLDLQSGQEYGPYMRSEGKHLIISNVPTDGMADGGRVRLTQVFRVGKPRTLPDGRTYHVLESIAK